MCYIFHVFHKTVSLTLVFFPQFMKSIFSHSYFLYFFPRLSSYYLFTSLVIFILHCTNKSVSLLPEIYILCCVITAKEGEKNWLLRWGKKNIEKEIYGAMRWEGGRRSKEK